MLQLKKIKVLIEGVVEDVLLEVSGMTPNVFWLVTSISDKNSDRLEQIADGTLHGVKGISDNKKILMHWLGVGRNAVLIMPTSATMSINGGLYKIQYDDPYDLLRNDMELLSRIWNKEHGTSLGRRGVLVNISNNLVRVLKRSGDSVANDLAHSIYGGYVNLESDVPSIDTLTEMAEFIRKRTLEGVNEYKKKIFDPLPIDWWKTFISQAIVEGVKTYESEGEWVVTDEILKIPAGSRLLVAVDKKPKDFPPEVFEQLKQGKNVGFPGITQGHIYSAPIIKAVYEHGLDKRYQVRFIDLGKFKEIQTSLQIKHFK